MLLEKGLDGYESVPGLFRRKKTNGRDYKRATSIWIGTEKTVFHRLPLGRHVSISVPWEIDWS